MQDWSGSSTTARNEEQAEEQSHYDGEPVLVPGDAGEHVVELCKRLKAAGHETHVAAGAATPMLDDAVYRAVEDFRREAGVEDELTRNGELKIVGPATWAALAKAAA